LLWRPCFCAARPLSSQEDLLRNLGVARPETFENPLGIQATTDQVLTKALFCCLAEVWPRALPLEAVWSRARELLLTGDPINGETAYQWGLVNRLARADEAVAIAAELVRRVSRHDAEAIAAQKRLHEEWLNLPYEQAVERSVEALVDAFRAGRPQDIAANRLRRS